jgi:polygalacturonase
MYIFFGWIYGGPRMPFSQSRRQLLRLGAAVTVAAGATGTAGATGGASAEAAPPDDPWRIAATLRSGVQPPRFPARWFDVTRFGATGDGISDCTQAIRRAIGACTRAGGGHVVFPAGRFATGPIHLRDSVDLHVTKDATIAFSPDPAAYLPAVLTRYEGVELYNYSPLIYAYGRHDIAVTGEGVLDGQADTTHWWPWCGSADYGWRPGQPNQTAARAALFAMAERGVPTDQRIFGDGQCLRPSFIQANRCRNVLIEGVTIHASPMWVVHPVLSQRVLVRGVTVATHGPNNDGCNPDSCQDVVIHDCGFDTGDDCVAVKSGRNADGRRVNVPSERILIEDCEFRAGHGGVTIGSEMSGGVRDVFAQRLRMTSPSLNIALRFKTNSVRGGFVHGFHARDVTVGSVTQAAIEVNFFYEEGPGFGFNPDVANLDIAGLTVSHAGRAFNLRGYPDAPIRDVRLTDVTVDTTDQPDTFENVEGLVLRNVREQGVRLPDTGAPPPHT